MSESSFLIREIQLKDNAKIEKIMRDIFIEFELPFIGTTMEDKELSHMYESYQNENEVYYIIEDNGEVVGGAGIKPLNGYDGKVCELQKMYFSPEMRGKGYGKIIFNKCLNKAREFGYEQCYLESASVLKTAIHIYESNGFRHLDTHMGNTGHYACGVWMIKDL
ncbi:MAG: GNAT family N-acetyltransferase [Bacteroidia bacterium]|nr:GNAT family N-acetyltransferase [Bacteroidia bacterium]NND52205.1 GNAT family N-acetyltransferase [Flavobacteriaceae bacterium]